jgi:D-alanyl-lipoteichoic acid acyltransferase DltB (MBOAT superfamily)
MAKKVLIADTLAIPVTVGYGDVGALDSPSAVLVMLFYTMQIYFDFSGYCDMATGIGCMFNIDITQNFNSPYKSITILDFWKRWHMTLTRFLTNYVYIPLGGSRKGRIRTYLNVCVVFLISGIWHGANWTFILWGAMHGVFSVITRIFRSFFEKLPKYVSWLITFIFINITWIYFRAASIGEANAMIKRIFSLEVTESLKITDVSEIPEIYAVQFLLHRLGDNAVTGAVLITVLVCSLIASVTLKNTDEKLLGFVPTRMNLAGTAMLFVWCLISCAGVTTFIYWNF